MSCIVLPTHVHNYCDLVQTRNGSLQTAKHYRSGVSAKNPAYHFHTCGVLCGSGKSVWSHGAKEILSTSDLGVSVKGGPADFRVVESLVSDDTAEAAWVRSDSGLLEVFGASALRRPYRGPRNELSRKASW